MKQVAPSIKPTPSSPGSSSRTTCSSTRSSRSSSSRSTAAASPATTRPSEQQYSDVSASRGMACSAWRLTSTPARVAAVFGTCSNAGASVDAACLRAFVKSFGEIALRHPLSDDDVTFYAATATSTPPSKSDLVNVIAVLLSSPRFLYRVESGGAEVALDVYALDAWELAARLSYHFWGTMPDATLRADAVSGALLTGRRVRGGGRSPPGRPARRRGPAQLLRAVVLAAARAAAARQPRERSRLQGVRGRGSAQLFAARAHAGRRARRRELGHRSRRRRR